jgi:iron complex transport system substrate-binding protein
VRRLNRWLAAATLAFAGATGAEVRVKDDSGAQVVLAQPARRIVSLSPHLTEQLFAIGAGSRIVGTTEFADYPDAARSIPRVARAHSVDLERVAAARPDLIVVWGSGFPPATLAALRRLGVPLLVDEPSKLDGIAGSMLRLGQLTATPVAIEAAAKFRAAVDALRAKYGARAEVRVFYQIWPQPLMTLGGRHVLSEALRVCGARNVFEALAPIAPQVSVEAVLAADPQLIVTAEAGGVDRGALDQWKSFFGRQEATQRPLVIIDADRINRHTPRLPDELAVLCERIDAVRKASAATKSRP